MNTKKEDLDAEKEETSDLVDAVYEYLMKKEYPKDCTATKKRQIRKKVESKKENLSSFQIMGRYSIYCQLAKAVAITISRFITSSSL